MIGHRSALAVESVHNLVGTVADTLPVLDTAGQQSQATPPDTANSFAQSHRFARRT